MDHTIALRLPASFDDLIPIDAAELTDAIRREYIATVLAVFIDNRHAPLVADALVRLNGGRVWPRGNVLRFQ